MPTLPHSGRRPASARRQLLAVLTAAFLLFQQAIILAPVATAQTSRATTSNKTTVSSGVRKSPAPTLDDTVPNAPSTTIVISQVYGGAGCGTAGCSTYKNDYIELFNRGTSPQSLNGWSVQYAAATGTAWQVTNLTNVTLQPGQYYLVGEGAGANGVNNIPAADVTGTIAMSATAAKIALANTTTALSGQCGNGAATTLPASVIDFVGYGTTANCNDAGATTGGAGNAPAPSTTNADIRAAAGCTDTDNNSTDFAAAAASPRNTATALNSCSVPTPTPTPGVTLSINDVSQDEGNAGTTSFTFTVSLSAPAQTGGVSFTVNTADGTTNPANAGSDYVAIVNGAGSIPEGSSSTQVTVQVNGDGTSEPNETFFVNLTNLTGASFAAGGEQGVGTIVNDDFTLRPIHDIQGSSTASPYAGQTVTTTGIVTLLRTGTNNGGAANSFFIQEPSPDADPNTSEGLLVFTNSVPTVAVGDSVRVTGAVTEFFNMTEISPTPTNVTVLSTGNTLPTPVTLDSTILDPTAPPAQPQLEKYEGMRMTAPSVVTVAPSDTFYEVETVLAGVERPVREPGMEISLPSVPPDPGEATPDCCIPRWDENPERIKLDTNGRAGAPLNGYTSNVTFSTVTGPLDFSFSEYKVVLEQTPTVLVLMPTITAPLPAPDEFTVASYNIENFNNNATQRQKAAQTVRGILHYPDIIGTIEIFDLADLQALRDQINNDAVAAGDPNPQYEAYLVEANGTSEDSDQDVGYLVKSSRVTVNSVTQEREEETYQVPGGGTATLHDRPPFVLDATVDPSGANPQRVIVIVNHLRSFICIEADADPAVAAGCTNGAADGPRVREKRRRQGESLAGLLQELQSNNPGVPVISVGDYNAFQFTDGFTNPVATVKGIATVDNELAVDASPDLVNPDFVNLIDTLPVLDRYSFVFEGTPQALDHHIVNAAARARNTRTGIARVNADFPEAPAALYANNPARVERNSDHDPVVSYYRLGAAQAAGSLVISEFRFRGPGSIDEASPVSGGDGGGPAAPGSSQDNDEFVELYNNTDNDIVVSTLDGSAGWAVVAADGVTRFIIPNDTVIPARGHFLGVNTDGYSLGFYGPPDSVLLPSDTSSTVSGYALDIPDGSGIALFGTADPANYTLANRLDAAGYSTVDPLYREGAGFPAPGAEATSDLEYSFVRKVCVTAGAGCGAGLPKDTADNSSDFVVVNTEAAPTTFGAKLGAPGPEGLTSPVNGNATMPATLLDPSVSASQPPNRVRSFGMHPSGNGTFGTLSIRRTITNNTGAPVRYLAFRIIDITTAPMPPTGTADVRALDSYDPGNEPLQVTVNGEPVDVYGTYVEQPPFQPHGGGLNSSMAVGFIDVNNQLENGDSISVQFLLGIMQTGNYRFYVNIEMINDGLVPEAPAVLKRRKLRMDTQRQQQQERQRPRRVTR